MGTKTYDLIVIGAGVAGLLASGRAAERGAKVLLLEKMERPARKLRITGKGRCNITNTRGLNEFLTKIQGGSDFVRTALQHFDNQSTIQFFNSINLETIEERGGRIFPKSSSAADVASSLENWARGNGVEIRCNSAVESVQCVENQVKTVQLKSGEVIDCQNVLITTGGVSYPRTGSSGDGHQMAYDLGHQIEPLRPALVPLSIDESIEKYSGLELRNVKATLMVDNEAIDERFGDVDFTDVALGGATILQLSRRAVESIIDKKKVAIDLDLKSGLSTSKLIARINRDIESLPTAPLRVILDRLTPRPLHAKIARSANLKTETIASLLTPQDRATLAATLKSLRFGIKDYRGFNEAIITVGGVDLKEVNKETMESRIIKNLYFAGEILNIDADTGGYNIQLALSTARLAADSIQF